MRAVDDVLSNMDNPDYDMRLYTPLERIVHAAHMQEVWQEAGYIFKKMAEQKSIPDDVCACMRDSERNGIHEMLRLITLKVRWTHGLEWKLLYLSLC